MEKKERKSSTAERELERRRRRQELYADAIEDLTALRNHYRAEVRVKLEKKVAKQRREREERKAQDKAELEEKEKKRLSHTFTIKLPKSTDIEDRFFLKNVTFSKSYLINEIRNQMEKDNELNRKYKVDEFNRFMTSPLVLKRAKCAKLKGHKLTFEMLTKFAQEATKDYQTDERGKVQSQRTKDIHLQTDKVKQGEEEERKEKLKFQKSTDALDEIFPAIQYPEMAMVHRDLGSPEPNLIQKIARLKRGKRREEVEKQKRMAEKMFQVSQLYEAATNRLMKMQTNLDFQALAEVKDTREIFEQHHEAEASERPPTSFSTMDELDIDSKIYKYLDSLKESHIGDKASKKKNGSKKRFTEPRRDPRASRSTDYSVWAGRVYSDEILRNEILGITGDKREPRNHAPLTMTALEQTTKVKTLKSEPLWRNPEG